MRIVPIILLLLILVACAQERSLEEQGFHRCDDFQRMKIKYGIMKFNDLQMSINGTLVMWTASIDTTEDEEGNTWCRIVSTTDGAVSR